MALRLLQALAPVPGGKSTCFGWQAWRRIPTLPVLRPHALNPNETSLQRSSLVAIRITTQAVARLGSRAVQIIPAYRHSSHHGWVAWVSMDLVKLSVSLGTGRPFCAGTTFITFKAAQLVLQ